MFTFLNGQTKGYWVNQWYYIYLEEIVSYMNMSLKSVVGNWWRWEYHLEVRSWTDM